MSAKKPPTYAASNHQAAAIILADPRRHLRCGDVETEGLSVEEIEASLMVKTSRKIIASEEQVEEFKLS